jgi:hypothetical protein
MSQPRDDRQDDLFRPSLEKIINLRHPLVRLVAGIDWDFLAGRFSSVCRVGPGQPPLRTRSVAGLFILKHMQQESLSVAHRSGAIDARRRRLQLQLLLRWFEELLRVVLLTVWHGLPPPRLAQSDAQKHSSWTTRQQFADRR